MNWERFVDEWYQSRGILEPDAIDMEGIAREIDVQVIDADCQTVALCRRGIILVDRRLSPIERREQLAYALAQITLGCGGQVYTDSKFLKLKEHQAASLARKILVPRFMARRELRSAQDRDVMEYLASRFRVSPQLIRRRLRRLRRLTPSPWWRNPARMVLGALAALDAICMMLDGVISCLT
jgi:hypothetical protein